MIYRMLHFFFFLFLSRIGRIDCLNLYLCLLLNKLFLYSAGRGRVWIARGR